jgi:hypothetical protein
VSLGAGFLGATVSGGPKAIEGAGGPGLSVLLDWRLAERLAFDLRAGGFYPPMAAPEEIAYPADDGDYALLFLGFHHDVLASGRAAAWLGLEVALHYAQMESYAYSLGGWGVGPSFGGDLALGGPFVLRVGGHLSWVSLESSSEVRSGTSLLLAGTADLLFVFR